MIDYDVIIEGGTIIDGTRFPRFEGDIGISGGRIAKIGNLRAACANRRINAQGRVVAPGFIDTHTHFDGQIFWDPTCAPAAQNGITTVIMANCGFGFAPCRPADRPRAMQMMQTTEQIPTQQLAAGLPWDWVSFPDFLDSLRRIPKAINAMSYIPLNPLMVHVMGIDAAKSRRPTGVEIDGMKDLIDAAMNAGALGLSLSSMSNASNHVDIDGQPMPTDRAHIDDLCSIVQILRDRNDGIIQVTSQVGSNGDSEVSIRLAAASGRPVIHNIFNTSRQRPDLHTRSMAWLDDVLASGLQMFAASLAGRAWTEQDFWNSPGSALDSIPVHRALTIETPTLEGRMALASDEAYRARFRKEYSPVMLDAIGGGLDGYSVVSMGATRAGHAAIGRTLGSIAREGNKPVTDVYLDLALESHFDLVLKTDSTVKDAQQVAELISHSHVLAGTSDGGAHTKIFSGSGWTTDLLIWMVRDSGLKTLEEMHYRLAYQPARAVGLRDRGALLEGQAADIVIYDLKELFWDDSGYAVVHDMPKGDWRRSIKSGGYAWILVNGQVTFAAGRATGAAPGAVLQVTENRGAHTAAPAIQRTEQDFQ